MQHVRGLVRRASQGTLRALEANSRGHDASSTVIQASLIDSLGNKDNMQLVHISNIMDSLDNCPAPDALRELREARALLESSSSTDVSADMRSFASNEGAPIQLYVKDMVKATKHEIQQRQLRIICKQEGRLLARNLDKATLFVKTLLDKRAAGTAFSELDVATYRGIVEELCALGDTEAALALAINPDLPLLNAAVGASLAKVPDTSSAAAVSAYLEGFAPKDDHVPAHESCATHLALRLQRESATAHTSFLDKTHTFNIDPSTVYPRDKNAIQSWASHHLSPQMLPAQRAEAILQCVAQRSLLPRRICIDSLSAWCLSSLCRPWVTAALDGTAGPSQALPTSVAAAHLKASLSLVLKDPKRNLVENRLLREYAMLLERGEIDPSCESFPYFLEECGECHGDERPPSLSFTLPAPTNNILSALRKLAPRCAFWTALLDHCPEGIKAFAAPCGEVRVTVALPTAHECVLEASHMQTQLPPMPTLYEDDHLIVIDKPAGIATTRHALSSTQLGRPTTDLLSVMMLRKPEITGSFRQGQVHRLDTETSGCLILSKTTAASDSLRHQMGTSGAYSQHTKVYLAMCIVLEPELSRLPLKGELCDPSDAKIRTRYRIVKYSKRDRVALVECRIPQGKKHQIRRHLSSAGMPIVGDVEHGGAACVSPLMDRVALHASCISFVHPISGKHITVSAPLPADFHRALSHLNTKNV